MLLENIDRPGINAKETQSPVLRVEVVDGYARVVLHDRFAVIEHPVTHLGEVVLVHEVGSGLGKAGACAQAFAELEESSIRRAIG